MHELNDIPLRPDLKGQVPYGAPQISVPVALNVNENTFGVPEVVALEIIKRLAAEVVQLNRYPDREFMGLRQSLADYLGYGLSAEQLWAANGSNEVLMQAFQAFGGPSSSAISFGPTYSMYPNIARISLTPYREMEREGDYELSSNYVADQISGAKPGIVLLCNPNNPTGTPLALEVIEAAYSAFDGILIVDEAYAEFSMEDSSLSLLPGRPRLMVSRTMSKAFAFAGARVGYVAADAAAIDALRIVRLPYHLSSLTQAAAQAALAFSELMLQNVAQIKVQRNRIIEQVTAMGLRAYRSESNFVLVEGFLDPNEIFEKLLERGILIRNVGIPGCLRFTAGTELETTKLLAELAMVLD